jgi:hypothetical protein
MANRRHSPRRIKRRWTYNVREAAKATGATPGTVRNWQKQGLQSVPDCWPPIFRGIDIIEFFALRSASRKQRCGPGQIYCLRCKGPKFPAMGRVEYRPDTARRGALVGGCPDCGKPIFRRSSPATFCAAAGDLTVSMTSGESSLIEMSDPHCNRRLK